PAGRPAGQQLDQQQTLLVGKALSNEELGSPPPDQTRFIGRGRSPQVDKRIPASYERGIDNLVLGAGVPVHTPDHPGQRGEQDEAPEYRPSSRHNVPPRVATGTSPRTPR